MEGNDGLYCLFSDKQSLFTSHHLYQYRQNEVPESFYGYVLPNQEPVDFHPQLAMQIGRLRKENSELVRRSLEAKEYSVNPTDHKAIHTASYRQKRCVFCQMNKVKTRSGWKVLTQYRCSQCEVALCTGERNCFYNYHKLLMNLDTDCKKDTT